MIDARFAVYRLFDEVGQLLYVGASTNLPERMRMHRKERPWWPLVARARVQVFRSREEMFAAERAVIRAENPLHNRMRYRRVRTNRHGVGKTKNRTIRVSHAMWAEWGESATEAGQTITDWVREGVNEEVARRRALRRGGPTPTI